jgi:subtilisin family serine protease
MSQSARPRSALRRITHLMLVALATLAVTFSMVADSYAQMMGRGFSFGGGRMGMGRPMMNRPMMVKRPPMMMKRPPVIGNRNIGKRGTNLGDYRPRHPGETRPRYPGDHRPRRPHRHPPIIFVRPMLPPYIPGGTTTVTSIPGGAPQGISQNSGPPQQNQQPPQQPSLRNGFNPPPPGENRFVRNEVLLNISPTITLSAFDQIARRHRLVRLDVRNFTLPVRRIARLRINDGRPVATVIRSLQREASIIDAQPNYLYSAEQGPSAAADPMQYAFGKMRLPEAHALARGESVRVAVIDTTIDTKHPVLAGVVTELFDATGAADKPHSHGTGVAGVIAAHGRLLGVAPSVKILGINAFSSKAAKGDTMSILVGLERAGTARADVVNMSFAGPADPEMLLKIKALRQQGAVLIGAAGNAGPNSRPLFPAAYAEVIAVTATDAEDKLFDQANRGTHIAVAAPGVAILAAAPEGSYKMQSGTSFAAAQVSGVVALLLERNRKLDAPAIRQLLTSTARDLGAPGHDEQFGSGLVDAFAAVEQAAPRTSDVSGAAQTRTH